MDWMNRNRNRFTQVGLSGSIQGMNMNSRTPQGKISEWYWYWICIWVDRDICICIYICIYTIYCTAVLYYYCNYCENDVLL